MGKLDQSSTSLLSSSNCWICKITRVHALSCSCSHSNFSAPRAAQRLPGLPLSLLLLRELVFIPPFSWDWTRAAMGKATASPSRKAKRGSGSSLSFHTKATLLISVCGLHPYNLNVSIHSNCDETSLNILGYKSHFTLSHRQRPISSILL